MKRSTLLVVPLSLFGALLHAGCAAEPPSPEELCATICACEGCDADEASFCRRQYDYADKIDKESSCRAEYDDYLTCLNEASCVDHRIDERACRAELRAWENCDAPIEF